MPGVLERRGEDVDLRWWRGWRCLGERERRRRGLGVEDGYGRRGEREGEVDMGRRWRARWRPGEREWWWRGLGVVDGYGWRGERGARRGVWGEGEVDVGRQWRVWLRRGEREWWWRGLGGRWGEGEGDMGRRWRSWWCPGERERRERGPWGSWWYLGERERREWVVEARWDCGRRGRVCRAGGGAGAPPFAGPAPVARVGPVRKRRRPLGGLAWCRLGGEVPRRPWGPFGHRMVAGGVRGKEVTSPIGSPVKLQANTAPLGSCGLPGTPSRVFLTGLGGKECFISVHSVDEDEVGLSPSVLAEAQFVVCVICALLAWAKNGKWPKATAAAPLHPFPFPT